MPEPALTPALQEAVDTFGSLEPLMRLELLLDYADRLPPLPERYRAAVDAGLGRVHECQSPVFLFAEVEDGTARLYASVPEEAPTVRGCVSLLIDGLDGEPPEAVQAVPDDLFGRIGITQAIGMMRQQGLQGVLRRLKASVDAAQTG